MTAGPSLTHLCHSTINFVVCTTRHSYSDMVGCNLRAEGAHEATRVHHSADNQACYWPFHSLIGRWYEAQFSCSLPAMTRLLLPLGPAIHRRKNATTPVVPPTGRERRPAPTGPPPSLPIG